ncbi:hypothetical protein ACFX2C_013918 [Malus domestica]
MEEQERKEVWVMNKKTESKDFPTDSSKIFSAMRMENQVILSSSFSLRQYLPRFCVSLFVLNHANRRFLVLHTVRASSDPLRGCNSNGQVFDLVSHITVHPVLYDALKYKMRGGLASVHKIANQAHEVAPTRIPARKGSCGGFWAFGFVDWRDSHKTVFPHILSPIRLAENGRSGKGKRFRKEALDWEADGLYEGFGEFGTWFLLLWLLW